MYMTHEDLHTFYHQVHLNVAKKLEIEDFEWKSAKELADDIQNKNNRVASRLNDLIDAYADWFKTHEEIDESGSPGNLSTEQNKKLMGVIGKRDSTRNALIDELKKL